MIDNDILSFLKKMGKCTHIQDIANACDPLWTHLYDAIQRLLDSGQIRLCNNSPPRVTPTDQRWYELVI